MKLASDITINSSHEGICAELERKNPTALV